MKKSNREFNKTPKELSKFLWNNKPIKNFQKKKYYTNKNYVKKNFIPKDNKKYPDLDGTFAVDPLTWKVKYIPKDK